MNQRLSMSSEATASPFSQTLQLLRKVARYHRAPGMEQLVGQQEIQPIDVAGRSPGVLCLHGFCGVPGEVALCAGVAADLGLQAKAPLLPGHGTSPNHLAPLSFRDWVDGAREHFDALSARGPVILAGLSMGSLVATALALERPDRVAGLVLMANAFWLKTPFPSLALDLADRLGLPDFGVPKLRSDLGDEEAARTHVSYQVQPTHAAISVLHAGRELRQHLWRIQAPTLILHGARDRICPVANAWKAAQAIGNSNTRVVIFPRSHHILTRDTDREQVREELEHFMKHLRERVPD